MTFLLNLATLIIGAFILGTVVLLVKAIKEMVNAEKEDKKRKEFRRLFELTDLRA